MAQFAAVPPLCPEAGSPSRAAPVTPVWLTVLLIITAGVLFVLAADRTVRGLTAVKQSTELMYGEAILYDHAARILRGEALYQPIDQPPYSIAAYTPLYYVIVAAARELIGPGFGPGRLVSLVAGLLAVALVARMAAHRAASRAAGVFAALLFLAFGFPGDYPWFAFYKEDMLGVTLSLGALAAVNRGPTFSRVALAAVLAAAALLTKQTFIAAPLAIVVWLWLRDRQRALLFGGIVIAIAGGVCLHQQLTTGSLVANTVFANINPSRSDVLLYNVEPLLRHQGAVLVLALLAIGLRPRATRGWGADLIILYWLATLLPLAGLTKVGSNWNYWMDLAAATAILATTEVWAARKAGVATRRAGVAQAAPLLLLLAAPLWLPQPAIDLDTAVARALEPDEHQAREFAGVLERVRAEPRAVLAEPLDILTLADRPIVFEPYVFAILHREERWDANPLVRAICAGEVGLLVLDHAVEGPDWAYHGYAHWPPPVLQGLRETMQLERQQAGLYLYTPRADTNIAHICQSNR